MRIDEILASDGPVFSFEFFPPKTEAGEKNLYAALAELRTLEPAFVSVTYGAGGSTREKTIEMLQRVGVSSPEERVSQLASQLSGGLRQRAMIAMALSCNPTLLIADEPTTALDVTTQRQILRLMRQLQQDDGMAIMLITHDLGVVAEMARDVAVMYLGRVVEQAPVDEIFHAPRHPYTKALLRSIPRIRSSARMRLTPIAGSVPHPYDRPSGCPFHPRCEDFMAGRCDRQEPNLRLVSDRHAVSCFLYE